ncbi:MAG: carboxylesterase [Glaciecola sp.]|jgi:carboxylesterase
MAMNVTPITGAEAWSAPGIGEAARVGCVVVHGFTGNPNSTRPLGEFLASQGHAVEVVRLPGHGTNVKDMATTRYADWRAEVAGVVDDLASRTDRIVLIGLSMGATICLDVAASSPDQVDAVASINAPILDRKGLLAKLAPYLEKILPVVPAKLAGIVENDIAKGGDEKGYDKVPAASANSLLVELPRIRAKLLDLTMPVLVAVSAQDHTVPPENSAALRELLGSQRVTHLPLERSFHVATLDHDAPLIEQAVLALIAEIA